MTSNDLSSKFGPLPRVLTWAKRYGAAEVTGTLTAYLGYFTMLGMTQNDVASAYGGSIGESLGFFGVMIIRERRTARHRFDRTACNGHCFILPGPRDWHPRGQAGVGFSVFMLAFPEGTIALLKAAVLRQIETQKAPQSQ